MTRGLIVRFRTELAQQREGGSRLTRLVVHTVESPGIVLLAAAAAVGVTGALLRQDGDQVRFRAAGLGMIGPGFLHVFSDSWLQIGPLYLLGLGLIARLGALLNLSGTTIGALSGAIQALLCTAVALAATRAAARATGASVAVAQWAVGGVVVFGGLLGDGVVAGHPEELILGFMLALAAARAISARTGRSTVLVVLASGVKQWAVTTGGMLLASGRRRSALLWSAACVAGVAAVYAPFSLWGDAHTLSMSWSFPRGSWLDALPVSHDGWTFRALQGGIAGLAGVAVGLRRRGSPFAPAIVAIAVRLLLDPLRLTYYWGALVAVTLTWAWTSPANAVRRSRLPLTLAALALTWCDLVPYGPWWHGETVAAIALIGFVVVADRPPSQAPNQRTPQDGIPSTGEHATDPIDDRPRAGVSTSVLPEG